MEAMAVDDHAQLRNSARICEHADRAAIVLTNQPTNEEVLS
jgi:hypothetical protein